MNHTEQNKQTPAFPSTVPMEIFRAMSDHSPEGILLVDLATRRIVEANEPLNRLFGVDPAQILHRSADEIGRAFAPALDDPVDFSIKFNHSLDIPEASGRFDLLRPGACEPTIVAYVTPIRNEHGEVTTKLWSFCDTSSQRALEKRLREARSLETTARLAAGIVHDSNNLLTVIIAQLYHAEMELQAVPGVEAMLQPAMEAAEKCGNLLSTVLKLAHEREGSLKRVQWEAVLHEVEALARAAAPDRISIRTSCEAGLPPVQANPVQLHQVMMNLVFNAIDAMPGQGELEMALSRQGADVCLTVKDNGEGIPPDVQERIFEAFFTTKEEGRGTGLGLHMVADIIKTHQGTIRCESEPGVGTTFRMALPQAAVTVAEDAVFSSAESSQPEAVSC